MVVILRESRVPMFLAVEVFEYVPSVHVPDRTPTMHALSQKVSVGAGAGCIPHTKKGSTSRRVHVYMYVHQQQLVKWPRDP